MKEADFLLVADSVKIGIVLTLLDGIEGRTRLEREALQRSITDLSIIHEGLMAKLGHTIEQRAQIIEHDG